MAAALAGLAATAVAVPAAAEPSPTATTCDPTRTPPAYAGKVPDPKDVLGFGLGEREVTTAQSDRLLRTISRTSARVVDGVAATSARGRAVRYAIAGRPENVTRAGLARIRAATARLRDPRTPDAEVRRLARTTPQILWIAGNVHGNEESGTDASLRVLRDLADRTDCAARRIVDHAIVVIMPTQNPDGREADTRANAYDFDMNRDWFARTQPEVDGKVALTQAYPPLLFIDAHEMPGDPGYFFPPNADPIYHETPEQSVKWINDTYGAAMAEEFTDRGIPFFNGEPFDLFYQGYGDTVLRPAARTAAPVAAPAPPSAARTPRIGVLDLTATLTGARQSTGWLRSRLDRDWRLPFRLLDPAAVRGGALENVDVLLVPDVPAADAEKALGDAGGDAVRSYVTGGGRYVGWAGGTELAARLKVTGVTLTKATSAVPGSLFRADVRTSGPLARGVGGTVWNFYASQPLMKAADPGDVAVSYPAATDPDWFVSGYQEGAEELGGTAAVVDEKVGAGRSVQFATDPNFRSYTDGTAKLLFNAVTGGGSGGTSTAASARRLASRAARDLDAPGQDIRIAVRPGAASGTEAALRGIGVRWSKLTTDRQVTYVIANRWGDAAGERAWIRRLPATLRAAGVKPLLLTVP